MTPYHLHDAILELPPQLKDKSMHLFTLTDDGPSEFNVVVSRADIAPEESLEDFIQRLTAELRNALPKFALQDNRERPFGDSPAIELSYSWRNDGIFMHQRQVVTLVQGPSLDQPQALMIAGTCIRAFNDQWNQTFDRILDSVQLRHPLGHSPSMNWLLKGLLIGAAIGIAAVAVIGTGGLAAGGAGLGEVFSTMSWAPKEVCGHIEGDCTSNAFINGIRAARAHVDVVNCAKHSLPHPPIATGSGNVFINGQPAARVGDKITCGAVITKGSGNVYIGGGTQQTDPINPENLVPGAVHAALLLVVVVGLASAAILAGPVVAVAGLVGGVAGGLGGEWVGGKLFGEGSDGQKWMMLGGSLLGGAAGAKGGSVLANKWIPQPLSTTQGFMKGGLPGTKQAAQNRSALAKELAEKRVEANSAGLGRVTGDFSTIYKKAPAAKAEIDAMADEIASNDLRKGT